mmetsp:Transcript_21371/g.46567  ORF Transcript_21371/g.46567 Transcript_21371/m.46567 type:complete len:273 (-) Transcript_21371:12-830(-)
MRRHHLSPAKDKTALIGFSLGCIYSGHAFVHDGFGDRLLCIVGHLDLPRFAESFSGTVLPAVASTPVGDLAQGIIKDRWGWPAGWVPLLKTLQQLIHGHEDLILRLSPAASARQVGKDRRVRILVGDIDPCVRIEDAQRCAALFHDGACFVSKGLDHGTHRDGAEAYYHVVRRFVLAQLSGIFPPAAPRTESGWSTPSTSLRVGVAGPDPTAARSRPFGVSENGRQFIVGNYGGVPTRPPAQQQPQHPGTQHSAEPAAEPTVLDEFLNWWRK